MSEIFLVVTLVAWLIGFLITILGLLKAGAVAITNMRRAPEDKRVFIPAAGFWIGVFLMVSGYIIINIIAALV